MYRNPYITSDFLNRALFYRLFYARIAINRIGLILGSFM